METRIEPIKKTVKIDYSKELLKNIWTEKNTALEKIDYRNVFIEHLKNIEDSVICIQSPTLEDRKLIECIFYAANHNRIYILVDSYTKELEHLKNVCLIRFGVKMKGSFLLVNPNISQAKGAFFSGNLDEANLENTQYACREIVQEEIIELYRHFCFYFWEKATEEVIAGEQETVTYKPLDIFHDIHVYDEKDFVFATIFDFKEQVERARMIDKKILKLSSEKEEPQIIKAFQKKDLGSHQIERLMPSDEFKQQKPDLKDDGISAQIEYEWENIPFYLPTQAKEHSFYKRWDEQQKDCEDFMGKLIENIKQIEEEEDRFSSKIKRFLLGKKTVFGGLKKEISAFKTIKFADLNQVELTGKINRLNEIDQKIQSEIEEIKEEDRVARIEEEIEKLQEEARDIEKNLEIAKYDLKKQEEQFSQTLRVFCEKQNIDFKELEKKEKEWKKDKKGAKDKLDKLNQIRRTSFVQKKKEELQKIEGELKRNTTSIENREREKTRITSASKQTSSLDNLDGKKKREKTEQKSKGIAIAEGLCQLPQVGKLFEHNQQLYLTIAYYEQYEQGLKEADRLNAKLCTTRI